MTTSIRKTRLSYQGNSAFVLQKTDFENIRITIPDWAYDYSQLIREHERLVVKQEDGENIDKRFIQLIDSLCEIPDDGVGEWEETMNNQESIVEYLKEAEDWESLPNKESLFKNSPLAKSLIDGFYEFAKLPETLEELKYFARRGEESRVSKDNHSIKVGDTVYFIDNSNRVCKCKILEFTDGMGKCKVSAKKNPIRQINELWYDLDAMISNHNSELNEKIDELKSRIIYSKGGVRS